MSNLLNQIFEAYPDDTFLKADGWDEAIVGLEENTMRLVYSKDAIIDMLVLDNEMDYDEAHEFFDYNIGGAYVGSQTPIFITQFFEI